MTRSFTIVAAIAAVAVGGFLLTAQAARRAHDQPTARTEKAQASATLAQANVQQAALALQAQQVETGSFAGTDLAAYPGISLVRADDHSYCLQIGTGATASHVDGPAGSITAGGC